MSYYDEQLAIVERDLTAHGKCPQCGWTPAEQDALSRDARKAERLRRLLDEACVLLEEVRNNSTEQWPALNDLLRRVGDPNAD